MRMRKPPRALGQNEPFRHADHPRPTTRRQFVAQGFLTGTGTILGPSLLGLMANPRTARTCPGRRPCVIITRRAACSEIMAMKAFGLERAEQALALNP